MLDDRNRSWNLPTPFSNSEEPSGLDGSPIPGLVQARLDAGHPPGRIAMEIEQLQPGLGRALLGSIKQAAVARGWRDEWAGGNHLPIQFSAKAGGMQPSVIGRQRFPAAVVHTGAAAVPIPARLNTPPRIAPDDNAYPHSELRMKPQARHFTLAAYGADDNKWGPSGGLLGALGRKAKNEFLNANPKVKENFRNIVQGVTGGTFSQEEINKISEEVIDNIGFKEGALFEHYKIDKNGNLYLNDEQWNIVNDTINMLPKDALGRRVRQAYRESIGTGRVRRIGDRNERRRR